MSQLPFGLKSSSFHFSSQASVLSNKAGKRMRQRIWVCILYYYLDFRSEEVKAMLKKSPYRNWIMLTSESFFYFGSPRSLIKQTKQLHFSRVAKRVQKGYRKLQLPLKQTMKEHGKSFFAFLLIKPKIHNYIAANISIWRVSSYDMENIVQVTRAAGLPISAITGSNWGLFLLTA